MSTAMAFDQVNRLLVHCLHPEACQLISAAWIAMYPERTGFTVISDPDDAWLVLYKNQHYVVIADKDQISFRVYI